MSVASVGNGTSIYAALGRTGSGKSYGLARKIAHAIRSSRWSVLVLDVNGEWSKPNAPILAALAGSPRIRVTHVGTTDEARRALEQGRRLVVVNGKAVGGDYAKPSNPFYAVADELARIAIEGGPTVLVLHEAQTSCHEGHPFPPHIGKIVLHHRHDAALLWVDSQQPANVRKELLAGCERIDLYATAAPRDLSQIERLADRSLSDAVREMSLHAVKAGESGWHIPLRVHAPEGPYVAQRIEGTKVRYLELGKPGRRAS
jgi:hypothetical protein